MGIHRGLLQQGLQKPLLAEYTTKIEAKQKKVQGMHNNFQEKSSAHQEVAAGRDLFR